MKRITAIIVLIILIFSMTACTAINEEQTLTLAWDFNVKKPVWQKLANEYNKISGKKINIKLDQKDGGTYASWLSNQLTVGKTTADIVINNGVTQFFNKGKFVDYSQYLNKPNPYADNEIWKTQMEKVSYPESSGSTNGQIYSLNTEQVITSWFYNKDIFDEYKIEEHVGKTVNEWNFDDLILACEFLKSKGKIPLAIGGDYSSFWSWQFGWLYRVYTDQYFRDLEESVMAVNGDYNYDEELQTSWEFNKEDIFNDTEEGYIVNMMRLAKDVSDGKIGPNHAKFKDMVKNLSRLAPEYVPRGFTSMKPDEAVKYFLKEEAVMYIDLISFYAGIERTFEDSGVEGFELGVFRHPPMTSQTEGVSVGVNYTRDTGGASGNYGVIYKNKKQADIAMDFMMFFASPQGQSIYLAAMAEENVAPQGISLVRNVEMPEKWIGKYDFDFPGSADSNPLASFSRGFMDEPESVREYVEQSQVFFGSQTISIDEYCSNLQQKACINSIPYWLRSMGYRTDAINNPALDPKK